MSSAWAIGMVIVLKPLSITSEKTKTKSRIGTATLGFTAEPGRFSCVEAVLWVEVTGERILLVERVERKREFNHGAEGGLALFRGEVGIVHQVVGDGEKP